MKISKDTQNAARRLFRMCVEKDVISEEKVRLVTAKVLERKPRNYVALLTAFSRLLSFAVRRRSASIRSADPLSDSERNAITQSLSQRYGAGLHYTWTVVPELLGGIRVQVGDDVLDGSLKSKIDRLADVARNLSK